MACKITRRTEHREITLNEFKKQKGYGDYKKFRQIAKAENFSLIFGGSASILSQYSLEIYWNINDVDQYIEDNHCEPELEEVRAKYKTFTEEHQRYVAAASRMRKGFFDGYPGLLTRCDREVDYAAKHGYCRSVFGSTRNLIELRLRGAYDNKFYSGELKNLENIAKNYLAQNFEACIRGRAMREIEDWLISKGYKSRVWNEIHDSIDYYIHKDELKDVLAHIKHVEERKVPELLDYWVPLPADCSLSDHSKGQYYKEENSAESFGVQWDNLEFEDPDPFGVELNPDLEKEYFDKRVAYWESKDETDPLARSIFRYRKEKGI